MKTVIITHGNCPDGSACVILANKIYKGLKAHHTGHKDTNDLCRDNLAQLEEGDELIFSDICADETVIMSTISQVRMRKAKLKIFEHHVSREWLKNYTSENDDYIHIEFDIDRCGARLFYDYHVEKFPEIKAYEAFVTRINDRDLWLNEDPESARLTRLHYIYGDEDFVERFTNNPDAEFLEHEQLLLKYNQKKDDHNTRKLLECMNVRLDSSGQTYGVVFGVGDSSEMLHQALEKYNLEYAIMANLNKKRASIRGRGNMDCAAYAQARGGGGHRCAAGFPLQFEYPDL